METNETHLLIESLDGSVFTELYKDADGRMILNVYDKEMNLVDTMIDQPTNANNKNSES